MHGIIPALLAGYDDDGEVDVARSTAAVDHLLAAGVNGVFLCGSTAEYPLQSLDERKKVIRAVTDHVAGRADVIAHVACADLASSVELARFASEAGVAAVAAVTPNYFTYTPASHADYYRSIAEVVEVPLLAYQIPSMAHVKLPTDWFAELAAECVLGGVKYTSSDLLQLGDLRRVIGPEFVILNGSDEVLLGGLALGADGGIGSTYNALPELYVELYRAFRHGDLEAARKCQGEALVFAEAMSGYDFIAFLREAVTVRGVPMGQSRAPLPRLDEVERGRVRQLLADVGVPTIAPALTP